MIKAILFDLGGVFATDPLPPTCRRLSRITGIEFEKISEITYRNFDPIQRGEITIKQYWRNVKKDLESDFNIDEIEKTFLESLEPYPRMISLVKKLKEKYKVGLLSNTEKENFEYWKKKYSFDKIFDVMFTSFEIGFRKPEKEIYQRTIEKLNLEPEEILFIDNQIENLKSAAKLGIRTIHYESYGKFLKELKKLL